MTSSLADLQTLRTVLGQLNAECPARRNPRLGETDYVDRADDFQERLHLELTSRRGKARILVTGQIGVGKSSELLCYYENHQGKRDSDWLILSDLEREEQPEHCGALGVLLTIFRDCWGATRALVRNRSDPDLHRLRDETLTRLIDWLKGRRSEDGSRVTFSFCGMDFPLFLNRPDEALALTLGKAAQHEAVSGRADRFGIAPDSLVNLLNRLLEWFQNKTRGRRVVLLVDHVDKIRDPQAAEEVLIKATPHWNRLAATIVMTAPYEDTLGELRHSVESKWGRPLIVYPVDIPNPDSGDVPGIYLEIVKRSGLSGLISVDSLRVLAHYSGGVLRQFVQFLIDACKEANFCGHAKVETVDAEAVIQAFARAYQDYAPDQLKLLDEIERYGTGLSKAAVLLRSPISLLVCRPTTDQQTIRVHPLSSRSLERFRLQQNRGNS